MKNLILELAKKGIQASQEYCHLEIAMRDGSIWSAGLERDENTGKPYRVAHNHRTGSITKTPIADREKGALQRIAEVCERNGLIYYNQTDPRGCALYVGLESALGGGDIHALYNRLCAVCA